MIDCCVHTKTNKKCLRNKYMKVFDLPRKFTRKQCERNIIGFTMRSSCAPYKYCHVIIIKVEKVEKVEKVDM